MTLKNSLESCNKMYQPTPTDKIKRIVRERDNHTCKLCSQPGKEVDHIIPLKQSHDSSLGNLRTLCKNCNLKTRTKRKDARLEKDE